MPASTVVPESNPWRLACAGDPQAIAQLLNRSLQARGIEAAATCQAQCLRLILRSPQPLNRDKVVAWLQAGLAKLNPTQFQRIEVAAWRSHAPAPDWQQEVKVSAPVPAGGHPQSAPAAAPAVNLERLAHTISVNIQAQDITGQVVVGNKNIVVGPGGHLVVNRLAAQPRPQIQPIAAKDRLQPPPVPHLLDRTEESQTIIAALGQNQSVECFSDRGFGKTALLCAIAHRPEVIAQFPAGMPYLSARRWPLADLWQAMFETFYTTDIPCKPTDTQIRRCLKGKSALVIVDDVNLDDEDLQALLYNFPDQTFLFATPYQHIWGAEAKALPLIGLPLPDAIALVEQALGRALSASEQRAAETLCRHLEGHPLRILQAIAKVKHRAMAIADVVQQVLAAPTPEQATLAELEQLPTPAKRILAVLTLLAGIPLQAAALADLSGTPEVATALADLQDWHWVIGDGQGYRLAANLLEPLQPWVALQAWLPHLVATVSRWLQTDLASLATLATQADPILQVITLAAQAEQWATVLELGRGLEPALILNGQWGRWEESLELQLQAAQALGDRATEAFVLHQLGSRSLALGDVLTAQSYLSEALALRDTLADPSGVEWTEHNLALLYSGTALEPDPSLDSLTTALPPSGSPPGHRFPVRWGAIAAVGVGVACLTGALWWSLRPRSLQIEVRPSELVFPATAINTPVTQDLTLSNPGRQALRLTDQDFTLAGAAQADYQILTNTCVDAAPLPPGEDCRVTVQFLPQVEGDHPALLRIQFAPNQQQDIPLQGRALPEEQPPAPATALALTPTALTFDRQELGTTSPVQPLALTNDGDTEVTFPLAALTLTGAHPQDFALDVDAACLDQTSAETTLTLAPGDRCDLPITFRPQEGGDRTATLNLAHAELASPLQVTLVGSGMTVPRLTLQRSPQPFGPIPIGQSSPAQTVQILSSGTGPLTITAVTLSGQETQAFRLGEQTCTNADLEPQATCSVSVLFAPRTAGLHSAQLQIQSNAADSPHLIPLSGEGQFRATPTPIPTPIPTPTPDPISPTPTPTPRPTARLVVTPNEIDFGYGTSDKNPQSLRLTHQGEGPLKIEQIILTGENPELFVLSHQCNGWVLSSSGEACLVEINFQPEGSDSRVNAQIEIYNSGTPAPVIIQLWGYVLI